MRRCLLKSERDFICEKHAWASSLFGRVETASKIFNLICEENLNIVNTKITLCPLTSWKFSILLTFFLSWFELLKAQSCGVLKRFNFYFLLKIHFPNRVKKIFVGKKIRNWRQLKILIRPTFVFIYNALSKRCSYANSSTTSGDWLGGIELLLARTVRCSVRQKRSTLMWTFSFLVDKSIDTKSRTKARLIVFGKFPQGNLAAGGEKSEINWLLNWIIKLIVCCSTTRLLSWNLFMRW